MRLIRYGLRYLSTKLFCSVFIRIMLNFESYVFVLKVGGLVVLELIVK